MAILKNLFYYQSMLPPQLYSIEMERQICAIKTKYGFGGNFKSIIDILASTKYFTLLEIGCKDSIAKFIIHNFKLDMVEDPWMYDPLGEMTRVIRSSKKCSTFFP